MTIYTQDACEDFIQKYVNDHGGDATTLREGCLGLGQVLLHGAPGKVTVLINEIYLNEWSSGHTVRRYQKMPKKYALLLDSL